MKTTSKIFLIICIFWAPPLWAEIRFDGFASIYAGLTSDKDETYLGYDDDLSFKPDSKFALQATAELGDGLGAVGQIMSRGSDEFDVELEWAYVSYDLTDSWRVIMGRQRIPLFSYSDFLDIGYAYHWVRPPDNIYGVPFTAFDGLLNNINWYIGELENNLQFYLGRNTDDLVPRGSTESSPANVKLLGASYKISQDWWEVRLNALHLDATLEVAQIGMLADTVSQAGFTSVADDVLVNEDTIIFTGVGFSLNFDSVFVIGEYTDVSNDSPSWINDQTNFYFSGGVPLNSVTLHLTYGEQENTPQLDALNSLPAGVNPQLDGLRAATENVLRLQSSEYSYITAGLKWGFHPRAVFKAEVTALEDDLRGNDATLVNAGVDVVF